MFINVLVHNQNDYWSLEHKVFFDPVKRHIHVYDNTTELDIKKDLYSAMKEWFNIEGRGTRKFKPPIRVIGGDDTVAGQTAGDIYFLKEGWRVVYDPTKVVVTGVLFSDDFDTPWLYSEDITQEVFPALVSSLVTGVDIEAVTAPSASTVAAAVRTELTTELANLDAPVSDVPNQVWEEDLSTHNTVGTSGNWVYKKLLTTKKFVGLSK